MALTLYFTLDLRALRDGNGEPVYPAPVEFHAKPFLEKDHRDLMQIHFGLSEDERKEKQHDYNAAFLSKVAAKAPKGIPGFPEEHDDLEKAVYDTLSPKTEANEMLAELLVSAHLEASGNRYFFR